MAAGYLSHLAGGAIEFRSASSEPADEINPMAIQAMAEEGIDITSALPKILTTDAVKASDVVVAMGCGDACPSYPGKQYEDWVLEDPAGHDLDRVRRIRDEIRLRVEALIDELSPGPAATGSVPTAAETGLLHASAEARCGSGSGAESDPGARR